MAPIEIAIHAVSVLFFTFCGFYMFSPWSIFPYHPLFMCLGYGVLMGEAILFSRYIKSRQRKWWLQFHLTAQLVGYLLVTIAFTIILYSKISKNKSHFQSWHAIFGGIAFGITTIQILFGLFIYYCRKRLIKWRGVPFAIQLSRFHGYSGIVSHGLSIYALTLGYCSNFARSLLGYQISSLLIFFTVLISIVVIFYKPEIPTKVPSKRIVKPIPESSETAII